MENLTMIPIARYLKSAGNDVNVKVSIKRRPGKPLVIYMRDFEFHNVPAALAFLRHVSESELLPEPQDETVS